MTRTLTPAGRSLLAANGRKQASAGLLGMPGKFRSRQHPTWPVHRVRQTPGMDHSEAAKTFAGAWWATRAVYIGCGRGWFAWERPSDAERP